MGCPEDAPCEPWATETDLCCLTEGELPGTCVGGNPVDADQIANALAISSYVLWALTGRRFGVCTTKIRPCRKSCTGDSGALPWVAPWGEWGGWDGGFVQPLLYRGSWYNITCGCGNKCSCTEICEVVVPAPLCGIVEVKVDGVVLDPTAYRCDDWRTVVRTDGACWPLCQDMSADDTEDGTWSITVQHGVPVPPAGVAAAATLACEVLKSCTGAECRLPKRVESITRQGVTATFFDPQDFLTEGRTGLYDVDLFINAANPYRLSAPPMVWSPDVHPRWRVTDTCA